MPHNRNNQHSRGGTAPARSSAKDLSRWWSKNKKYFGYRKVVGFMALLLVVLAMFDAVSLDFISNFRAQWLQQSQQALTLRQQEVNLLNAELNAQATTAERLASAELLSAESEARQTIADAEAYRIRAEADTASAEAESERLISESQEQSRQAESMAQSLAITNSAHATLSMAQAEANSLWMEGLAELFASLLYLTLIGLAGFMGLYYLNAFGKQYREYNAVVLHERKQLLKANNAQAIRNTRLGNPVREATQSLPDPAERVLEGSQEMFEADDQFAGEESVLRTLATDEAKSVADGIPFKHFVDKHLDLESRELMVMKSVRNSNTKHRGEVPHDAQELIRVFVEDGCTEVQVAKSYGLPVGVVRDIVSNPVADTVSVP